MTQKPQNGPILFAYLCIYLVWGTTYLAIAMALKALPPFSSCALRFLLASALLYGWLRWRGPRPLAGLPVGVVVTTGVLMCGLGNGFTVYAQQGVPSGIAALMNSAIPICVTLLDWAWFARRRPTVYAGVGLVIGIGGVALIVTGTGSFAGLKGLGYLAALVVAVSSWSLGTLLQRGRVAAERMLALACGQMATGGLFHIGAALANGEAPRFDLAAVPAPAWAAVLYLAVFGSVLAQSSYLWLLSHVPAQKVTTYALVNPVVAMLLGALFLAEPVTAVTVFGACLVLGGVAMVLFQGQLARVLALAGLGRRDLADP